MTITNTHFDEIGHAEVQQCFERGDYNDPKELRAVKKWSEAKNKECEFLVACERASISSALDANKAAQRANLIAVLALVISAISAREQISAVLGTILNIFGP